MPTKKLPATDCWGPESPAPQANKYCSGVLLQSSVVICSLLFSSKALLGKDLGTFFALHLRNVARTRSDTIRRTINKTVYKIMSPRGQSYLLLPCSL